MKKVVVVISTFNGANNITRQLDSIFMQIGVDISVLIRDDNSRDDTIKVVKEYINQTGYNIRIITGENEGYGKSFWDALCSSEEADYYAFSDQDDVWKKDKLIKTITPMEEASFTGPMLAYCKMQRSDEKLKRLAEQVRVLKPAELSKKICLTRTFNYGAATVINKEARDLICRSWPNRDDVPHDLWAGLLCYWFGKVFYVDEELYYWIRYGDSVTGEGTKKSGIRYRLKETLNGKSYPNIANELVKTYSDLLTKEDIVFLTDIIQYKSVLKSRLKLIFDSDFRRDTLIGTLTLKLGIVLGWF